MEPYKPHRMGDHSDSWGCSGDDDPCYCTKPKEVSLQKESEWELFENIQGSVYAAFFSEAGEDDFEEFDNWRKNVLPRIVSKSIATAVSTREKEIAEEVNKLEKEMPDRIDEEDVPGVTDQVIGHNNAIEKILQLLKH